MIAITDDDCIPPDDWLERLIAALDRHGAAVSGGVFQETDPLLDAIRRRKPVPTAEQVDLAGVVGNGGNILYRRRILEECRSMDGYIFHEALRSGQDWELMLRLRRRHAKVVFVPNPVVHLRKASLKEHLRHCFKRGVGIAMLYRIQREGTSDAIAQDSLLWGSNGKRSNPQWGRAVWEKLIGPFGRKDFQTASQYWLFWLGEKSQALGFIWGLLTTRRLQARDHETTYRRAA